MGRRARALSAGASAVKERAGVPSRAGETLRTQRRPPARKERASVGGRPRDRWWCACTSDPRRPPQEAAAPAAGSRRAGMPRLLAPLLCLTLLPALAARGRRLRARNFAHPSETSAAPCARRGWMGVRTPTARVGSRSWRMGHGDLASSRVRGVLLFSPPLPGGLALPRAPEVGGSSVWGSGASGPGRLPWLALGQPCLGLAAGADRLPAPATFRFESNRFWFPVASWDHYFLSSSPLARAGADVGALCSPCLARGRGDVPWIPSPGFRDRCPLRDTNFRRGACCLGWGVRLTHFGSLGLLHGQRLEPGGGGHLFACWHHRTGTSEEACSDQLHPSPSNWRGKLPALFLKVGFYVSLQLGPPHRRLISGAS